MNIQQLLSRYEQTQKVGHSTIAKPSANVVIASQRIGYPDQVHKTQPTLFKGKNHTIHTSRDKIKCIKNRNTELSKISSNNVEFIDTNLGSDRNKAIIEEINALIEKLLSNVETGSYYYLVVNDMYSLLALFKANVYKFDTYTLHDYRNYLEELFAVVDNSDYNEVIGNDEQTNNLKRLIQKIQFQIQEVIDLMYATAQK